MTGMYQLIPPQEPLADPATGRITRTWWRYFQAAFSATGNGHTLGTAALENIGTSGANVPLLDGDNEWSGVDNFIGGFELVGNAVSIAGPLTLLGSFPTTINVTGPTNITLPTSGTLLTNTLPNGDIFVGSSSNIARATSMSGDASIVSSGVLSLSTTGVTASTYPNATITVNAKGRITSASSGTAGTVTSVSSGTGLTSTPNPITSTGTISLIIPVTVANGGTATTTLTSHSVLLGEGTSAVAFAATTAAGAILIDQGSGADPGFKPVTGAVTVSSTGATAFAPIAAFSVLGNAASTAAAPSATTATVRMGGTGSTSQTAHGVLIGNGSSTISVTAVGSTSQIFMGQGASADPSFVTMSGDGALSSSAALTVSKLGGVPFAVTNASSWTPVDNSAAALTFTSNTQWVQYGNLVWAYGTILWPVTTSAANASVGGLPITSANATYAQVQFYAGATGTIGVAGEIVKNTKTFNLLNQVTGANVTNIQMSGDNINFMCVYPAA